MRLLLQHSTLNELMMLINYPLPIVKAADIFDGTWQINELTIIFNVCLLINQTIKTFLFFLYLGKSGKISGWSRENWNLCASSFSFIKISREICFHSIVEWNKFVEK